MEKQYDAIFLNYDTINTSYAGGGIALYNDLQQYCKDLLVPCYIFKAPCFEALILYSVISEELCYSAIRCHRGQDIHECLSVRTVFLEYIMNSDFHAIEQYTHPSISFGQYVLCYTTAESRIAQLVNKITTTYGNIWRCTKGSMGNCWFMNCNSIINAASYYCETNKNPENFHTCLCNSDKFLALLQSVNAKSIYDLYMPFNKCARTLVYTQTQELTEDLECIQDINSLKLYRQKRGQSSDSTHCFE